MVDVGVVVGLVVSVEVELEEVEVGNSGSGPGRYEIPEIGMKIKY